MCGACGGTLEPDAEVIGGLRGRERIARRAQSLLSAVKVSALPTGWAIREPTGRWEVARTLRELAGAVARRLGVTEADARHRLLAG